jgi:glutamate synthase (NADPH/NADH) small chain
MAKPTGFIEFKRETIKETSPLERIKHWEEFKEKFPLEKRKKQAARCMDCGIPFCNSGVLINGMTSGCPLGNLIPEWNELVYKGLWLDAIERLYKTNNFPEFTGRVCPAPCEGSCTVGINLPQVTIKNIEYDIAEMAYTLGWVRPQIPENRTGKKIGVIGSGPSGLACAEQLNIAGHWVTVFERADRVGGLLTYGIPNMKLDKKIIQKRVDVMKSSGIEFKTNTEVGVDIKASELLENYDAIVLATGSTAPRDLQVEGRNQKGIHFAMEFLKKNTKSYLDSNHSDGQFISAQNKNVVIIGGGDTGTDCVATSIRHGCKSVVQLEILPEPSAQRTDDNPWPQWPKTLKVDYGQEESIEKFGKDPRLYCQMTKSFVGDEHGNVTGIEVAEVEWKKSVSGGMVPVEIPSTQKILPADLVLIAMGFLGPENSLLKEFGVETDPRTNIKAQYGKFKTNVPKVFGAGDARRGQSLVVWAINEGRGVAREVDKFLMGTSNLAK